MDKVANLNHKSIFQIEKKSLNTLPGVGSYHKD